MLPLGTHGLLECTVHLHGAAGPHHATLLLDHCVSGRELLHAAVVQSLQGSSALGTDDEDGGMSVQCPVPWECTLRVMLRNRFSLSSLTMPNTTNMVMWTNMGPSGTTMRSSVLSEPLHFSSSHTFTFCITHRPISHLISCGRTVGSMDTGSGTTTSSSMLEHPARRCRTTVGSVPVSSQSELTFGVDHHNHVTVMHKKNNIDITKKTHAGCHYSAHTARAHGVSASGTMALSSWNESGSFMSVYDRAFPLDALMGAAMYNAR